MTDDYLADLIGRVVLIVKDILASGSAKTVEASSKPTLGLLRLDPAFSWSHSNFNAILSSSSNQ